MSDTETPPSGPPLLKWQYVERAKLLLEITAILIAGLWAYTRFTTDDEPGLGARPDINAKLEWEKVTPTDCQANYEVQFQNVGKTPISIAETRISVWYLADVPSGSASGPVRYIDPMSIRQGPPLYSQPNDRLVGTYGPSIRDTEGFSFQVQNLKGKRILFEIEIWSAEDAKKTPRPPKSTWQDFHWDHVCGAPGEAPK